ncbi:MAG: hypothetical protein M0Z77_10620 [Thermoplasmatales archaeon]|nr:hypothetical protein [Thermoplasmatales archaeon]
MASIDTGKVRRIGMIFRKDGRTLISALDHGGEDALITGIEHISEVIRKVVQGGVDAILINEGILEKIGGTIESRVPIILNIPLMGGFVKNAISLGAEAVKTTYFGEVPISIPVAEKMREVAMEAREYGVPYFNEYVPMESGNLSFDPILIARAARAAAEYGADVVKTSYTEKFEIVTSAVPVPVIIAGGPPDKDIFSAMRAVIKKGGAGGAIGRSIFQSKNQEEVIRELVKIVHGDSI